MLVFNRMMRDWGGEDILSYFDSQGHPVLFQINILKKFRETTVKSWSITWKGMADLGFG